MTEPERPYSCRGKIVLYRGWQVASCRDDAWAFKLAMMLNTFHREHGPL